MYKRILYTLKFIPVYYSVLFLSFYNNYKVSNRFKDQDNHSQLEKLFNQYGSDKASKHKYHEIYGDYLGPIKTSKGLCIEIGLGTNDLSIPSNMGGVGVPGGSLRALREFFPFMEMVGCDIDKNILFSEERIRCFYLNQLITSSFAELVECLKNNSGFNLAIIDGLHQPLADLNSVRLLLPHLRINGFIFVEDIQANWYSKINWVIFKLLAPETIKISKRVTSRNSTIMVIHRIF